MNVKEEMVRVKYEDKGYDVIKSGVPDLILLKDGIISFVEVKSDNDKLLESQIRAIGLLNKHGFRVDIERVNVLFGPHNINIESKSFYTTIQKDRRFVLPEKLMNEMDWVVGDKVILEIKDDKLIIENLGITVKPLEERLNDV
jgi:hypothetical protein